MCCAWDFSFTRTHTYNDIYVYMMHTRFLPSNISIPLTHLLIFYFFIHKIYTIHIISRWATGNNKFFSGESNVFYDASLYICLNFTHTAFSSSTNHPLKDVDQGYFKKKYQFFVIFFHILFYKFQNEFFFFLFWERVSISASLWGRRPGPGELKEAVHHTGMAG